jgi:hypothetical protein
MKIILENAGVECTTNKQQTTNTNIQHAAAYKEVNPLNVELQKLK